MQKTRIDQLIAELDSQPVAMLLLRNYIHAQLPLAKIGNIPQMIEVEEANQKGLGISLNSISFIRSILAVKSEKHSHDITYLYNDLGEPESWKGFRDLETHLKTDTGSFNEGISYKDGFIFGIERELLNGLINSSPEDSAFGFYHHKIVGGEPRGEFYSVFHELFGTDITETLGGLFEPMAVGSGTTSQVSDQCLGALFGGPLCKSQQYRLRKTKKSLTLDIGYLLMYGCHLKQEVIDKLDCAGFDFSSVLNPKIKLIDTADSLIECCRNAGIDRDYNRPAELFESKKLAFFAENNKANGNNRVICQSVIGGILEETDLTSYVYSIDGLGG